MAGKDAVVPEWEIKGPVLTEAIAHQYKCTIKRGVMKFSFSLEFTIVGGKISLLKNRLLMRLSKSMHYIPKYNIVLIL
jgi:hypothetical protein